MASLHQIEIRFYCGLENFIPTAEYKQTIRMQIPEGFTVKMLPEKLNIADEVASIFLVNGVYKDYDVILSDGDQITIYPALCGG